MNRSCKQAPAWTRISVRNFFVAVALLCIFLGYQANQAHQQRRAVVRLRMAEAHVVYYRPLVPRMIRPPLEQDFLSDVWALDLAGSKVSDNDLSAVKELRSLRRLDLSCTRVGDQALGYLQDLSQLETLELSNTRVTDAGLCHLQGLKRLRLLDVSGTSVSGKGLKQLTSLKRLEVLGLARTKVSVADLEYLDELTSLEQVSLPGTPDMYFDDPFDCIPPQPTTPSSKLALRWMDRGRAIILRTVSGPFANRLPTGETLQPYSGHCR